MSASKILIVDDEPIGRQLLEAILHQHDYDLSFAADGLEAFETATQLIPDLILLDVMMPEIDGYEVCKRLREQNSTSHVPIILITALDDRDSRIRGLEAGADDYITKPLDRIEILAKVKTITQLKRVRGGAAEEATEVKEKEKTVEPVIQSNIGLEDFLLKSIRETAIVLGEANHFVLSSTPLKSTILCHSKKGSKDIYFLVSQTKSEESVELLSYYFRDIYYKTLRELKSISAGKMINKFLANIDRSILNMEGFNNNNSLGISVCVINREEEELQFAGINNSILVSTLSNLQQFKGTMSGTILPAEDAKITFQTVDFNEGEMVFVYNHLIDNSILENFNGSVNDNQFTALLQKHRDSKNEINEIFNNLSAQALIDNYVLMGIRF